MNALDKVPVFSKEHVKTVMDFLLNMTQFISEMTMHEVEKKALNNTLRASEEKFRSIVELSVDGIALIDKECNIIAWNKGQENITGLAKEEVLNRPIYDAQYQLVPESRKNDQIYQMMKLELIYHLSKF